MHKKNILKKSFLHVVFNFKFQSVKLLFFFSLLFFRYLLLTYQSFSKADEISRILINVFSINSLLYLNLPHALGRPRPNKNLLILRHNLPR